MNTLFYCFFELPIQKISKSKVRTVITSLPVIVIIVLLIISSALQWSITHLSDKYVLPVLESRESIITVNKDGYSGDLGKENTNFTDAELSRLGQIYGVRSVDKVIPLQGLQATTHGLLADQDIVVNKMVAVSNNTAVKLGADSFQFDTPKPIPIIIGANSLGTFSPLADPYSLSQAKQSALLKEFEQTGSLTQESSDYESLQDLKDAEFTMNFGQLLYNPTVYVNQEKQIPTFGIIPMDLHTRLESELQKYINTSADFNQLRQGITLKFKVAAIDYSANASSISIPYDAANFLYGRLFDNFVKAGGMRLKDSDEIHFAGSEIQEDVLQPGVNGYLGYSGTIANSLPLTVFIPGIVTQTGLSSLAHSQKFATAFQKQASPTVAVIAAQPQSVLDITSQLTLLGYTHISSHQSVMAIHDYVKSVTSVLSGLRLVLLLLLLLLIVMLQWRTLKNVQHAVGTIRLLGLTKFKAGIYLFCLFSWNILLSSVIGIMLGGLLTVLSVWLLTVNASSDLLPFGKALLQYGVSLQPALPALLGIDILDLSAKLGSAIILSLLLLSIFIMVRLSQNSLAMLKDS